MDADFHWGAYGYRWNGIRPSEQFERGRESCFCQSKRSGFGICDRHDRHWQFLCLSSANHFLVVADSLCRELLMVLGVRLFANRNQLHCRNRDDSERSSLIMKVAYFLTLAVILIVLGMLFFPSLHGVILGTDRTGMLPLLSASITILPWAFLGFVVYAIFHKRAS